MQRIFKPFDAPDLEAFKRKVLALSASMEPCCLLESNNYELYPYSNFGFFLALGELASVTGTNGRDFLSDLQHFHDAMGGWMFGYLSYDLKNQVEPGLESRNPDRLGFPPGYFFIPRYLFRFHDGRLELGVTDESHRDEIAGLLASADPGDHSAESRTCVTLQSRMSRQDYLERVRGLLGHIQRGDIYEVNFCMEFFNDRAEIDPIAVFDHLNRISRAPFGAYLRQGGHYLMCSSPERYLKKWHDTVISQPIKGTKRRGADGAADARLKEELRNDPKERAENIMITDLVRNDLSRIALRGSVAVQELCGIYTFEQVHQMISTVTCRVDPGLPFTDIIRATFPMGSMTGAPKIRAMELIDEYETISRGLYSGAVGYITPQANFDFNVVIRSILYNAAEKYLSAQAGSALTIDCDPEREYEECLLKARAMREVLGSMVQGR